MGKKKRALEFTTRLTREDAAGVIEALIEGLKEGRLRVQKSGETLELEVPRVIDLEVEAEITPERAEFEIEVSWRPNREENPDISESKPAGEKSGKNGDMKEAAKAAKRAAKEAEKALKESAGAVKKAFKDKAEKARKAAEEAAETVRSAAENALQSAESAARSVLDKVKKPPKTDTAGQSAEAPATGSSEGGRTGPDAPKSTAKKPAGAKSAAKKPAAEKPVTAKPAAPKSAAQKSAVKKPAAKKAAPTKNGAASGAKPSAAPKMAEPEPQKSAGKTPDTTKP